MLPFMCVHLPTQFPFWNVSKEAQTHIFGSLSVSFVVVTRLIMHPLDKPKTPFFAISIPS